LVADELLLGHPKVDFELFDPLLVVAGLYAATALWLSFRRRTSGPLWLYAAIDLVVLSALTYASGDGASDFQRVFFVIPIAAAFLMSPRAAALWGALAIAAFVVLSLLPAPAGQDASTSSTVAFVVYLGWFALAAVLLSQMLSTRSRRISQLISDLREVSASRGQHVAAAIDAEERERRKLAEALHDDAVQNLLAARQDVVEAERGNATYLADARASIERTVSQLREAIFELRPPLLEDAGLQATLEAVAERHARQGGYHASVHVTDDGSRIDDQLMFSFARELLINAAKHARCSHVEVTVDRRHDSLTLEVTDDGVGFGHEQQMTAVRNGHIGLASIAERAHALGGKLTITGQRGHGTRVTIDIPLRRERRRVSRDEDSAVRHAIFA
jgi:two-component system NarL family sensor kinase